MEISCAFKDVVCWVTADVGCGADVDSRCLCFLLFFMTGGADGILKPGSTKADSAEFVRVPPALELITESVLGAGALNPESWKPDSAEFDLVPVSPSADLIAFLDFDLGAGTLNPDSAELVLVPSIDSSEPFLFLESEIVLEPVIGTSGAMTLVVSFSLLGSLTLFLMGLPAFLFIFFGLVTMWDISLTGAERGGPKKTN